MDNHFENNIEEIDQIITRSKKDKSTSIFRIQRSRRLKIVQLNETIKECYVDSLEGVNMHLLSKEGFLIYGASDRMHLPDVITRLYQSLDNLLKANKGHKVQNEITISNLPTETISRIEYLDIAEWDIEYLTSKMNEVYTLVPEGLKEKINLKISLDGNHALWLIANSLGGRSEFDDFVMVLTWEISLKSNTSKNLCVSRIISVSDLRNKKINTEEVLIDITSYANLLLTDYKPAALKEVKADAVLLDSELANVSFYNLLRSNSTKNLSENYTFEDHPDNGLIREQICKYGIELPEKIEMDLQQDFAEQNRSFFAFSTEEENRGVKVSRQYSYYDQVTPHFRNIQLKPKGKTDQIDFNLDLIEDSINEVKKKYGISKLLFLAGLKSNYLNENCYWRILEPVVALYSDEKGLRKVDVHYFTLPTPDEKSPLVFLGTANNSVYRLDVTELPFTVNTGSLCLIKSEEEFTVA
jgi:hypothetical protein